MSVARLFSQTLCKSKLEKFLEQHPDMKQVPPNLIKEVIDLYKDWKDCCQRPFSITFSQRVLGYVAECMVHCSFNDSQYTADFLNYIFAIDGSFQRIMLEYVPESTERYKLADYLLQSAYWHKILIQGDRIPCTKTEVHRIGLKLTILDVAASISPNPKLLHLMLRYGAVLSYNRMCVDPNLLRHLGAEGTTEIWRFVPIIWTVTRMLQLNPTCLPINDLQLDPENMDVYKELACNAELLLSDFPLARPLSLPYVPSAGLKESQDYFLKVCNIVPTFQNYFMKPLKLKQACRFTIRKILNEKWLLPHEIYQLQIPESLKLYLDLRYDQD